MSTTTYSPSLASNNSYNPGKKIQRRQKFSQIEDQILSKLVNQYGKNNWEKVASHLINRTAKQCKDHYLNYIMTCSVRTPWTQEEDSILMRKYNEMGPKWTQMVAFFNGRSANTLKNRWNYYLSKQQLRKVHNISDCHSRINETTDFDMKNENFPLDITSSDETISITASMNSSPLEKQLNSPIVVQDSSNDLYSYWMNASKLVAQQQMKLIQQQHQLMLQQQQIQKQMQIAQKNRQIQDQKKDENISLENINFDTLIDSDTFEQLFQGEDTIDFDDISSTSFQDELSLENGFVF